TFRNRTKGLGPEIRRAVKGALLEDLGTPRRDQTTQILLRGFKRHATAMIISKAPPTSVVCGLALVKEVFRQLDPKIKTKIFLEDGATVHAGQEIMRLKGEARAILMGERTALNFLRHLSAVATHTQHFVEKVNGTKLQILDTRKTTPGLRLLEKYA